MRDLFVPNYFWMIYSLSIYIFYSVCSFILVVWFLCLSSNFAATPGLLPLSHSKNLVSSGHTTQKKTDEFILPGCAKWRKP